MAEIKDWLIATAGTLPSGGVIKPPTLTYLDAMNALEIMDPAMDSGMNASPLGAFDAHAALSPAQVVWIMDAMTAREVAWLRGGTLAQTIFTSLHYHNAQSLAPPPDGPEEGYATTEAACVALRAFVLAYAKAVDVAYGIVLDANGPARDGEDMWLDPYGVPLDTTETAAQVAAYVEQITQWLAQWQPHDDAWSQVVLRLQFRRQWLEVLQLRQARTFPRRAFELAPKSVAVPWAFDNVTPFLRQNMPFPAVKLPDHSEAWDAMCTAISHLAGVGDINGLSLAGREQFLRTRVDGMLPLVRCVYKMVICDMPRGDEMVTEWLFDAGAISADGDALAVLQPESTAERRMFALWRDIVNGTLRLNLSAGLSNPARRRRSFLHLSEAWARQAAQAARISTLSAVVPALRARALDCALHAHLLAFPLHLVGAGEERAAWWAALVFARARAALGPGWARAVARAWAAVASAMVLLYTLAYADKPQLEPSTPQFVLRHKILARSVGVSVSAWGRARAALDTSCSDRTAIIATARDWLESAQTHLTSPDLGPEFDVAAPLTDLRANIAVLRERDAPFEVVLAPGQSDLIPVLQ